MKAMVLVMGCLALLLSAAHAVEDPYEKIEFTEVFRNLITRDQEDQECTALVKSHNGLAEVVKKYSLELALDDVDFEKHMLIVGITDIIHTEVLHFLKHKGTGGYLLDYCDSGARYRLVAVAEGKKYSSIQILRIDRIEGIRHIEVKNVFVNVAVSKTYE